eukprot:CAMPEP_0168620016 /NCGR_PEP_ID=MMETSP0449_2-20121227/6909_1 /TAXON_ID=1082188 /ORGANISM="Strombidium rassoulzadegani, Strain ras09" /LENGTH=47 /DNA_ID= /DNA_START= /DNA_END= /DNA_ORIENTATION=
MAGVANNYPSHYDNTGSLPVHGHGGDSGFAGMDEDQAEIQRAIEESL